MTPLVARPAPTKGLNLSPSPAASLPVSLAEMQLIRGECAKCAEIERAGCTPSRTLGGGHFSHSPEQIQIFWEECWVGALSPARRDGKTSSRHFHHLPSRSFSASTRAFSSLQREEIKSPYPPPPHPTNGCSNTT